jgi:meso-butanediol dehydrogenase/(S,S)-butanediol dehydrogenase/diacetyl reductase
MWGMKDKVVVITGAANGIGRATAGVFAAEGAQVVMADVDLALAEKGAREIEVGGGKAFAVECDVSRSQSVKSMVDKVVEKFEHIDVLHANAAVQVTRPTCEVSEEEWDRMHSVNLKGVFLCCKYIIPIMQKQKKGAVIITSSGHAFATYPNCSAYAATKGGELAYMRAVALDYARDGVRVNCVVPGATDTRLVRSYVEESKNPEETRRQLLSSIPLGRLAKPEEIGQAVLFLASDFAAYITGTSLTVDGGILAQA